MPYPRRIDEPGLPLHLWCRGVAQRSIAEVRGEVRFFLARLAKQFRLGQIELLAYCFLTNHYHLFIRSPVGNFSRAMQNVLSPYVKRFNRRRGRNGPLFARRVNSKPVRSRGYFWNLLRYIDLNAKDAGLVTDPAEWEFGSARHYLEPADPKWLTRGPVEELICNAAGVDRYDPALYRKVLNLPQSRSVRELVERRMAMRGDLPDPLDDLLAASVETAKDWLQEQTRLADGASSVAPVVTVDSLLDAVASLSDESRRLTVRRRRGSVRATCLIETALMAQVCGLTQREVQFRRGCSKEKVAGELKLHRELLLDDSAYGELAAEVLTRALGIDNPPILL